MCITANRNERATLINRSRGCSSGLPPWLASHLALKAVIHLMLSKKGGDNLCSWLFKAGVLIAWCHNRPVSRKTVMTVNDAWLRALGRIYCHEK